MNTTVPKMEQFTHIFEPTGATGMHISINIQPKQCTKEKIIFNILDI